MNGESHGSSDEYSDDEPVIRMTRVARCPGPDCEFQIIHNTQEVWYWPTREMGTLMNAWRAAQGAGQDGQGAGQDGQGAGGQINIVVNAIQNNGALQPVAQPDNYMPPPRVWDPPSERDLYLEICEQWNERPEIFQVANDPTYQAGYQVPPRQYFDNDLHGTWMQGYVRRGVQRWYRWDIH